MPRRDVGSSFTCEHGGNRIPRRWAALFEHHHALLDSHRGWDPGALTLARALSKAMGAPLVASTTSRLLVDLNRSEHHRAVFSSITRALPEVERERILEQFYRPYRDRVERLVAAAIARGRVVHLSAHSFVPVLNGVTRRADVALLYDPARKPEKAFCDSWIAELKAELPTLTLRRNYPYRGSADGLTTALRRRHAATDYIGVEIEAESAAARIGRVRRGHAGFDQHAEGATSTEAVERSDQLVVLRLVRRQVLQVLVLEHELRRVRHPVDVQHAVEMVELVLEHRREKTLQFEHVRFAVEVLIRHAHVLRAFDETAQARHRQTTFPVAGGRGVDHLDASGSRTPSAASTACRRSGSVRRACR